MMSIRLPMNDGGRVRQVGGFASTAGCNSSVKLKVEP